MRKRTNKNKATLFILGQTKKDGKSYHYGFFYQEAESKYYINDEIIDNIISDIDWDLNKFEKGFLEKWRSCEKIHRKYCLNKITAEEYNKKIEQKYNEYFNEFEIDFGEGCDELINFLLRNLIG